MDLVKKWISKYHPFDLKMVHEGNYMIEKREQYWI